MAFDPSKYEQYLSEARTKRGLDLPETPTAPIGGMAKNPVLEALKSTPRQPSFFGDVGAYASAAKDQSDASLYRGVQEFSPIQGVTDWAKQKEQENLQLAEREMSRVSPEGQAAAEGMQWQDGGFKNASLKGTAMVASGAVYNPVTLGTIGASVASGGLAVPALVGGLAGGVMGSGAASQEAEQKALAEGQSQEQASSIAHEAAKSQFLPSAVANAAEGALVVGKALNPFKSLTKATVTAPVTQTAAAAGKYAAAKELGKRVVTGAATEGVTEGGEELTTSMSVNNALNRELIGPDTMDRTITGGLLGAISGGGMVAGAGGARMATQALGNAVGNTTPSTDQTDFDAAKLAEERAARGETGPLMTADRAQVIKDVVSGLSTSDPEMLAELQADPKSPFRDEAVAALNEQVAAGETEMEKSQTISNYLSEMRGKATDDKTRNYIDVFAERLSKDDNTDFGRRFAYNYAMGSFDPARLMPGEAPAFGEFQQYGQGAIAATQEGNAKTKPLSIKQVRFIAESFAGFRTALANSAPEEKAGLLAAITSTLKSKDKTHVSVANALFMDAEASGDTDTMSALSGLVSKSLAPKAAPGAATTSNDDSAPIAEESSARKLINSALAPKVTTPAPAADVVAEPVLDKTPVAQTPVVEPVVEPVVGPVVEPVVGPVVGPVVEPVVEPVVAAPLKKKTAKTKKALKAPPTSQQTEVVPNVQSENETTQAPSQEVAAPVEEKVSSIAELKKMLGVADEATTNVQKANVKSMLKQETAAKTLQKEEAESAGYVEPESEAAKQQAEATQAERHPNEVEQEGDTKDVKVVRRLLTKIVDARTALEAKTDALGDTAEMGADTAEELSAFEKAESIISGVITQLARGKITDPADVLAAQRFAVEIQLTTDKLSGGPSERIGALNRINQLAEDTQELFSKTQKPISGLQKVDVEKALRKWGFVSRVLGGRVRVVQSAKDIGKRYGVKGMFKNGKVYLVADHIADAGDARATLLHELGVHHGFRFAEVKQFAEEVRGWIESPTDTLQHKVAKAAMGRVLAAGVPAELVNEELVAYAVEEAAKLNPPPASKIGMWLRRLGRAVAKLFGGNPNMTPQDLVNYAYGAAQRATTEKRTVGGDVGLESVSPKAVTELASTIKGIFAGQDGMARATNLIIGKAFRSLTGQIKQQFNQTAPMRALAAMISSASEKYHKERHSWMTSFSGVFDGVRQSFVDLSRQDAGMYKHVMDALESEEKKADLEKIPAMKAALDKTFESGGKTMTGWDLLDATRKQMQQMVVRLKNEGVFIFNDKEKSLEVIDSKEPTYWPRKLDYSKVRKNADKLVADLSESADVRKAMGWKAEGEAGWNAKNDAHTNARNLVSMAASRSYDDPLYSMYGASSESALKKADGLVRLGEFRGGDDDLALVVARAFSAKNNRIMNPAVVEVMRPYYQKDATQVIQSYLTEAAARTAAHKSLGGWVAKDGSRYIKNYDELRSVLDRAIDVQKQSLKEQDITKPEWWIRQQAMERLAEDGGLYYSPVAFGDYAIRRMRTLGAKDESTDWLRDVFFPAQFNMLGQDMNPSLRQAQDVAMTAMKVPMLFFSTLTSVVEVGNLASRIANPALGKGLADSMAKSASAIGSVILKKATTPAAQKAVHDRILAHIGVVSNTITRAAMAATDSDKLLSPGLRKFTDGYFKFIGLNWWTNVVAEAAYNVAHVEIDSYVNSDTAEAKKELSDLGISREQWEAYTKDPLFANATPEEVYEHKRIHQDVYVALHKWVDGARLHPNPMTRTGWGNNPKYALLWMLNDFPYTFGAVTMGRVFSQMERNPTAAARIAYPVMIGVMFGMMGMMSNLLKDLVKESLEEGAEALGGKRTRFEPETFDKDGISQVLRSVTGSGSVFGSTEKIIKTFLHMIHNYRGNAFIMNASPAISTLMGINQIGLLDTAINQSALFTKAQKKAMRKGVHESINDPLDDFRKDLEEYFPK